MLNVEAQTLVSQTGRIPEARMLLMSGLMLADRTAGVEDRLKIIEDEVEGYRAEIDRLKTALKRAESQSSEPERVEVPMIPLGLTDNLSDLADKAEALAAEVEKKAG